jgi:hypothetical protein
MFSIEKKSGRFGEKSGKTKLKLYELKTITQDRTMAMRNSFFVLFVRVLDKFSKKKIGTITKESRKIRTNFKNYNFCMHSRS